MSRPDPIAVVVDQTPHEFLWPNKGKHRRTKEPYRDALKGAAAAGAINALKGKPWAWSGPIMLHVEVFWPNGTRRLDFDNMVAALKAATDGIFLKLDADDRQVLGMTVLQDWDRANNAGYMVYSIEAVETEGQVAA